MPLNLPNYDPASLPYILCGPIVRRLTRTQVCVWVALSAGDDVELHVRPHNSGQDTTTTVTPHRIGRHIWLAVLTAVGVDNGEFVDGGIYEYWLESLGWSDPPRRPNWPDLCLPGQNWPTFLGLPTTMEDFIIFHGSCRRAKGDRRDGLPQGFRLLVQEPAQRAHLLVMSGDQIYADEVGSPHMLILQGIADHLIGIDEYGGTSPGTGKVFSCVGTDCPMITGTAKPKIGGRAKRGPEMGLTIYEKDHLWTLAEYYGMYLTVWSDVLWPDPLPAFDGQASELVHYRDPDGGIPYGTDEGYWNWENHNLGNLVDTMPQVRKLLANTPTLMLFDDHETTDDWNLDYLVAEGIYNNPQGRRLVTNALLAYLLFQHWGNCPDRFALPDSPEGKALAAATWQNDPDYHPVDRAADLFADPDALLDLLGVPRTLPSVANFPTDGLDLRADLDPNRTIRYDFRLGPADGYPCHLVFPDERTARHMPGPTRKDRPGRISIWALDLMWPPPQPGEADLPTVLVAPAPVLGLHAVEHMLQPIFALQEGGERAREYEGWSGHTSTFEHMLARIGEWRRVIVLSGDVHFGYTHTLTYANPAGASPARAVQYVCSAFKYVMANTLKAHVLGDMVQKLGVLRPRTFYGYSQLSQNQLALLVQPPVAGSVLAYDSIADIALGRVIRHSLEPPAVLAEDVALAYAATDPDGTGQSNGFESPDWIYTVEHVADDRLLPLTAPHIAAPLTAAAALPAPWQGWDGEGSATMVKALLASDLHQIGRVLTGLPVFARITFSNGTTLISTQELFIAAGNDESTAEAQTVVTLTQAEL